MADNAMGGGKGGYKGGGKGGKGLSRDQLTGILSHVATVEGDTGGEGDPIRPMTNLARAMVRAGVEFTLRRAAYNSFLVSMEQNRPTVADGFRVELYIWNHLGEAADGTVEMRYQEEHVLIGLIHLAESPFTFF